MTIVLDASVILKWLLEDPAKEPDTEKALALIEALVDGNLEVLQPAHWLIEVAAVAARLTPQTAVQDVGLLSAMQFPTSDDPNVLLRATALAIETGHHLFDTLYHAVALEHGDAVLVTADDRYRRKAKSYGRIAALADWERVS
ncbi:MAG TPA: type II toxin-antitoxin system VapC family toxin [Steroidobacteraceae bacterium]|nr:type II toxin-antitoxin system VapC family toxin [Steroidobacteraceae bacterium]